MSRIRSVIVCAGTVCALTSAPFAVADNLFQDNSWAQMTTDRKASQVGDILSVVVAETAEARNSARNASGRSVGINGRLGSNSQTDVGNLEFGSNYSGQGEVRRSESLLTSISIAIDQVLPNGDYRVSGQQRMHINGEWTTIGVRGRIREADISSDNQIYSNRIADAEIDYNGQGFVSRGAQPSVVNWLFGLFGFA